MLFNIDEKQLMLELKNKDERALKICMNKYYRYVVYIVENIIGSALPYEDKEAVVSNVFVALWNYSADLDTDNYSTFKSQETWQKTHYEKPLRCILKITKMRFRLERTNILNTGR